MRMPAKFGSIKRVAVIKDMNSLKRNLNMYVISEAPNGKLMKTDQTIKNNLKTWLQNYRMINDTIDILDPFIINLGIEFVIRTSSNANKYDVLSNCVSALSAKYLNSLYIGESFLISDVYQALKEVANNHNINIDCGNCSYSDNEATYKLKINTKNDEGQVITKEYNNLLGLANSVVNGFDINAIYVLQGKKVSLEGYSYR